MVTRKLKSIATIQKRETKAVVKNEEAQDQRLEIKSKQTRQHESMKKKTQGKTHNNPEI